MHIIFNSEYKNTSDQVFIKALPQTIQNDCIEIATVNEFRTLIKNLNTSTKIKIWVHLGALEASENTLLGMVVVYKEDAIEFLNTNKIEFKKVTRGAERAVINEIVFTTHMSGSLNKEYTALELQELLNPPSLQDVKKERRAALVKMYKQEISNFNKDYIDFESFLTSIEDDWFKGLLYNSEVFNSLYWKFNLNTFVKYLRSSSNRIIDEEKIDVNDGIEYDYEREIWRIDYDFFEQVSKRLESQDDDYASKLQIATKLFLLHEAIHKHHKLDNNSVRGIGNFPRIIEYVDYQSDAVSMLLELSYQLKKETILNSDKLINAFQNIIKVAIETTFSFNPISNDLIQIRRVNRYNIWLYIYIKLDDIKLMELPIEKAFEKVYNLISKKPLIEVSGPNIISRNNRTFFEIKNITSTMEYAYLTSDNQLKRGGLTSNFSMHRLFEGFNNSSFSELYTELKKVII
jgi:hypothetical protein